MEGYVGREVERIREASENISGGDMANVFCYVIEDGYAPDVVSVAWLKTKYVTG